MRPYTDGPIGPRIDTNIIQDKLYSATLKTISVIQMHKVLKQTGGCDFITAAAVTFCINKLQLIKSNSNIQNVTTL